MFLSIYPKSSRFFIPVLCLLALLFGAIAAPTSAFAQMTQVSPAATGQDAAPAADADANVPDEAVDQLIKLLENEQTRQALIEKLKQSQDDASGTTTAAESTEAEEAPPSLARRLAAMTQSLADQSLGLFRQIFNAMQSIGMVFTGQTSVDWQRVAGVFVSIAMVAGATFGTYIVTRWFAYLLLQASEHRAASWPLLHRLGLRIGWSALDALLIGASWAVGYYVAWQLTEKPEIDIRHALFLNAFLVSELIAVVLRAIFSTRSRALRAFPIGDDAARYWQFWLARLAELSAYGLLLITPVVSIDISFLAGRGLRILMIVAIAVLAIVIVVRGRLTVRRGLEMAASRLDIPVISGFLRWFARLWHVVAVVYILASLIIWLTRPFDASSFVLTATLHSIGGFLVGVLASALLTRQLAHGVPLPMSLQQSLPRLQARLNRLIPNILRTVRALIVLGIVFWIIDAWKVVDITAWLASETGIALTGGFFSAFVIVAIAFCMHLAVMSWIEFRLSDSLGRMPTPRERTLLTLFQNAFTVVLLVVATLLALSELNVNIAPLLAGAGVLGLAVGFGAQKLVQDIITGAFIQIENAMNEGDVVTIAGISGVVERLTIRSVGLRDLDGIYHLIPFSSVDLVSNFMRGFAYHVAKIGVGYREDIDEVKHLMHVAFDKLHEEGMGDDIIGPLEMHGVTELGDSAVVVRARIKTKPGSQWAIGRAYNEQIKRVFDEHGVEIPFPHMTLYWGEDKTGNAPPLHIQEVAQTKEALSAEAEAAEETVDDDDRHVSAAPAKMPDSDDVQTG